MCGCGVVDEVQVWIVSALVPVFGSGPELDNFKVFSETKMQLSGFVIAIKLT